MGPDHSRSDCYGAWVNSVFFCFKNTTADNTDNDLSCELQQKLIYMLL